MYLVFIATNGTCIEPCLSLSLEWMESLMSTFSFSIVMTGRKKAKSKVLSPYPICKQKPEVRSSPSGLPQNCSCRWTHLLQLMAQQFPRRWRGVMVSTPSPREHFQECRVLDGSVDSHRWELTWHYWQLFHVCVFRWREDWIWMEHRHQRGYQKSSFQFPCGSLWLS